MFKWEEWKREEITQLHRGLGLFLIGTFLIYWFGNLAVYFWLNDVSILPKKEQNGVFTGLLLFFFGLGLIFWAGFILDKFAKEILIKPRKKVEAIAWEHFKISQEIEPIEVTGSIPEFVETLKPSPKAQMLSRSNKDIIKTTQPNAVLNEEDIEKIKISLNFTNTISKL